MNGEVWSLAEAVERLASPVVDLELSPLHGVPVVVVDLGGEPPHPELERLATLPVVAVGISPIDRADLDAFDVIVPDRSTAAPVTAACAANPMAAVTLVQLLRLQERLGRFDAVVAESLAYAALQAGPEHARFLAGQGRRVRPADPTPPVLVEQRPGELVLTLNRPRLRNPLSAELRDALVDALRAAAADPDRPHVHLRANGPAFCVGGDLAEFGTVADPATAHQIRSAANVAPWLIRLADRVTAHVHGACVGAGVELPAFCRHVVAAPDTVFSLPEVAMGLVPGAGGTVSVARRIGRHRAARLMLTGDRIDAATALAWGLVDTVEA
jgi:enoyl-CoA hydratase